jgi:hypothetical protein
VPTTLVEHEAEGKAPAHGAEPQRQDGTLSETDRAGPLAAVDVASVRPALLHPRLLLGLQARAGNAAVADLIARSHQPEPVQAPERPAAEPVAVETQTTEAPAPETPTAVPRPGETDDELAELDTAAEVPAAAQAEPANERELVAQDAHAELADQAGQSEVEPETSGGPAEPGSPIEVRPTPTVPDVSGAEPATGLARVGSLPPGQLLSSLTSVSGAVDRQATHEHEQLAASPPQRPRHPGAPSTVESQASTRIVPAERPPTTISTPPAGRDVEIRRPTPPPTIPEVPFHDGQLPTRDPGLELKPGPVPHLPLEGSADPGSVQQHRANLRTGLEREHASGQQEAAQPLGEDEVFPTVPAETLRAAVAQAPGANGHAAGAPGAPDDGQAPSIIAEQEKGAEIQGAVSAGLSSLASQRQDYTQRTAGERAKSDAEMKQLEQTNSQEQSGERVATKREVLGMRRQWTAAQQEVVAGAQSEADAKTSETVQAVAEERASAEQQAAVHYQEGQAAAERARREGEQQAAAERQKTQSQSPGGLLGAIGSVAQSLFDKAKQVVQSVFDRARQLVRSAIEKAQQLATAVMERARQTIVSAIRAAGSVLMAIGDRVLVAFPALRTRFRKAIQDRIAAAEAVVNKLATGLKQAVQGALNLLGSALSATIGLLHQGMQAAIDGVRSVVRGALDFAKGALAAFGTFAVLVKDIAANPGRWVANLAAAARDGIRNHLWPDLKASVQGWFKDKVDGILGLGSAVWSLLRRGGITVAHVATFAWEGIKSMIPQTVIWVLIEKLVALIVPAAAAVLLIIQALQAAWGSLSRILQAVDAFVAFLKGVRWGNAGALFGAAIGAGAVAVIEFISQFLLQRLMGAAGAVAGKLRALAKRIGGRLAAMGRGIKRGAKWLGGKARQVGGRLKGFARRTVARPQVRWQSWRLGRSLKNQHPQAFEKLRQIKADPSLDPTLKVQFLKAVRSRISPDVNPRALMTRVVAEDSDRFCLQGKLIAPEEIERVAPLTKLVSFEDVFDKGLLTDEYRIRFKNADAWREALTKDPTIFDASMHLKPEAELGRWWSPLKDTNEPTLEHAVSRRQLSDSYATGALRAHLAPEEAAKANFRKPTAFDAMFFDEWQLPPARGSWGFIRSGNGEVVIREAVTAPVKAASCSMFDVMLPNLPGAAASTGSQLVGALERLP